MKYYYIKTLRMMEYLTGLGYQVIKTIPDFNNPKYKVFLFEDTEELRGAMSGYKRV